jgi:ABC-type multidrug transport system ATPase subunit
MLTISNLSKVYPNKKKALDSISLTITTGMFGLLGPNGAGKSTLMRILATLQEPTTGSITLYGLDAIRQKQEVKRILGYLPQEFGFNKKDSALSMLRHFAILRGVTSATQRSMLVEALLHKVNLWDVKKEKLGDFSGGMKQRLGIALVLLGNPKLIIVDEPTAGLDPDERNRFHNLLSEMGEDVIVILSTHIVEDVRDLCTNMAIINNGKISLNESPYQAIAKLKGKIWTKQIDKKELSELSKRFNLISSRLFAGKTIVNIFSDVNPENGFSIATPSLEDAYFLNLKSCIH